MNFNELGLSAKVLAAVESAGYTTPTPIQADAIPHALAGRDVLGIAQTGTGKTAAFTLPMLSRLEQGRARARMPRTLILEPTRELAAQVEESFIKYGVNHKLNVALLIGGVSFGDQEAKIMRGADVLIVNAGPPARLCFERGKLLLTGIEILVIDEADRMLDMGFIPDIEKHLQTRAVHPADACSSRPRCRPRSRKLTETIPAQPRAHRSGPCGVDGPGRHPGARGLCPSGPAKRETLRAMIRDADAFKNAIIFCNRKRDVALLHRSLQKHGFSAGALHGDMDQRARMLSLDAFKTGDVALLVCSDVAARGLDIPDVSHVFNFDLPIHAEDYVHRIGRTGRAGKSGTALSIVTPSDTKYLAAIENVIARKVDWVGGKTLADAEAEPAVRDESDERRTSRRRSPRGDEARPRRDAERAPREARPERSATPRPERESAPRPKRDSAPREAAAPPRPATDGRRSERPRRDRFEEADTPTVGMGDHVPSFMLRPVRLPVRQAED